MTDDDECGRSIAFSNPALNYKKVKLSVDQWLQHARGDIFRHLKAKGDVDVEMGEGHDEGYWGWGDN